MTITLFLLVCLLAIVALGLRFRGPGKKDMPQRKLYYLGGWALLAFLAVWTINRYTYPADKVNVFGNSDYHVLEHLGYQFKDTLPLANRRHPETSIWDLVDGDALLIPGETYRIETDSFFRPIFRRDEVPGPWWEFWGSKRKADILQNDYYAGLDASEGLEFRMGDSLLVAIEISEFETGGDSLRYEVKFSEDKEAVTCDFNSPIRKGYPLADLLRYTPGWQGHDSLLTLFEGAWLIRTTQEDLSTSLTFFPSRPLQTLPGFRVIAGGKSIGAVETRMRKKLELGAGQEFYLGLGMVKSPEMRFQSQGRGHRLEFTFPEKYRLARKEDNQLFLCSRLQDVAQNVIQGGFLFPVFEEEANEFHVNATLRYRHGSSRERLTMQVTDHYTSEKRSSRSVEGGEEFNLKVQNRKSDLQWVMRLKDLRATNPVGRGHLFAFVIGFMLLVMLTMYWTGEQLPGVVEMSLYVLVFGFLLVRLLLQWRMGVFPPVDDAGPNTWHFLRDSTHYYYTVACVLLFFLLRWILLGVDGDNRKGLQGMWVQASGYLKPLGTWVRNRIATGPEFNWVKTLQSGSFWRFILVYLAAWAILFLFAVLVKKLDVDKLVRFANIAFPIAWFFFVQTIIDRHRSGAQDRFGWLNPYSVFNALMVLVFLAGRDAGFGIIFLLFVLLLQVYRVLVRPWGSKPRKKDKFYWRPALVSGALFLLVIFGADNFIRFVFARTAVFYWAMLLPGVLVVLGYFAAFAWQGLQKSARIRNVGITGGAVLATLVILSGWIQGQIGDYTHVKYRAAIQTQDPDQIIKQEQFATGRVGQVMRAAQNQWLISTYLREMEPEEGRKSSYFNLRPHFNKGASYTTQTTDLVVTRYLISEHGIGVVIMLLLMLLSVAGLFSFRVDLAGQNRFGPFGMLLLVFTIAMFIWLTATNHFIFFGQDFPLISLTSLFTLVFTLGLVLAALRGIPATSPKRSPGSKAVWVIAAPVLSLLLLGLLLQVFTGEVDEDKFEFNLSLDQARADFNELNDDFRSFQNTIPSGLSADSVMALFHESGRDNMDSSQVFTRTLYDHFLVKERDKMNPDHLLYMVQRPMQDLERRRTIYLFALNPNYYLVRPPRRSRKDWTGNLLAARETEGGVYLVGQDGERLLIPGDSALAGLETRLPDHLNHLRLALVPASWLAAEHPALLVWAGAMASGDKVPDFSITDSEDGDREVRPAYSDLVMRMRSGEVLSLDRPSRRGMRIRYDEDYKEFLAKNIWLNGDQRLFYPLGEQLLWAYYYAGSVRHARLRAEERHSDQRVSIDFSLSRGIHRIAEENFRRHNWDHQRLGVVVLDSKGRIRTLSDFKGNREMLDPNDIDEIHEKNREFHLRRNALDERQTFGNVNLLKLTHGAASSVKPLIYAAVTSQYNLRWRDLRTVSIPMSQRDKIRDPETKVLHYYGGRRVEIGWGGIGDTDFEAKSAKQYLVNSKNLYHSLVIFLGSYRKEYLRDNLIDARNSSRPTVFMPAWLRADSTDFPVVELNGGRWAFRKEAWPGSDEKQREFFGDKGSLLAEGLYDNLKLPTYSAKVRGEARRDYLDIDQPGSNIYEGADPGMRLYAYPELSHFYQADRALRTENPLWFIQGMRQPTAGNDPLVLTPLKIAEMTGKLFSQNRDFEAVLDDREVAGAELASWRVDSASWDKGGGYHQFVCDIIFSSMAEVLRPGGTASEFGWRLRKGSDYFYYGKTGTIGDADAADASPDKLMLLVISKGDVSKMNAEELARNKFYVVYFTGLEMYNKSNMAPVWDMYTSIVREIEKSYLFQSHMK